MLHACMPSSVHRNRLGLRLARCLSSSSTGNKADSSPLEERMVTATRQGGCVIRISTRAPCHVGTTTRQADASSELLRAI